MSGNSIVELSEISELAPKASDLNEDVIAHEVVDEEPDESGTFNFFNNGC